MVGVATFRLLTSPLHRHCYSSQQDELRTRIAGQRACRAGANLPCSQASVRTCPAGIQVRGYVDVRAHTREACEPRAYRSCAPLPPALPSVLSWCFSLLVDARRRSTVRGGAERSGAERSDCVRPKGFEEQPELEALSSLMECEKAPPCNPFSLVAFHH